MKFEPGLEGLRGLAVAAVVAFHVAGQAIPGGWVGVDIFFVLSGFLITSILRKELAETGSVDFGLFYLKRFARLVPAFAVLIVCAFAWSTFVSGSSRLPLVFSATYLMNWAMAFKWSDPGLVGHTWSLAIEEQFYLFWPMLLFLIRRNSVQTFLIAAYITSVAWRLYLVGADAGTSRIYYGFDSHCDGIILGCLIATIDLNRYRELASRHAVVPVCLLVALTAFMTTDYPYFVAAVGLTFSALLTGWIIIAATTDGWLKTLLSNPTLRYTGRISYGLYLWHLPLIIVFRDYLNPWQSALASFLVASISFHLLEMPIIRWSRRPRLPSRVFAVVEQ